MSAHLEAALGLARQGRHVFPLGIGSKYPMIPKARGGHGFKDATLDESQIAAWWYRWPRANIGVRTGEVSNLLVVDIDRRSGGDVSLVELEGHHGALPSTVTVLTPGGEHRWFAFPAGEELTIAAGRLGAGLDHRGNSGYVVAPPSRRPEGDYRWGKTDVPLAQPPEWLLARLRKPPRPAVERAVVVPDVAGRGRSRYAEAALERAVSEVATAPEGQGNGPLNGSAYSLGRLVGANPADAGRGEGGTPRRRAGPGDRDRGAGEDHHRLCPRRRHRQAPTAGPLRERGVVSRLITNPRHPGYGQRTHRQVRIPAPEGWPWRRLSVDAGMAGLLRQMWRCGLFTRFSCQGYAGEAWISTSPEVAKEFARIVTGTEEPEGWRFEYDGGDDSLTTWTGLAHVYFPSELIPTATEIFRRRAKDLAKRGLAVRLQDRPRRRPPAARPECHGQMSLVEVAS